MLKSNLTSIDTIVFDFGGVLIDWNPAYLYQKVFSLEEDMHYFLKNICKSEWNELQDAGQTLAEGTQSLIAKYPKYEDYIKMYYDRWEEMLNGCIPESVEILSKLYNDQKYRLYGLTNWSRETFPLAKERFPFLNFFEGIIVSGEVYLAKPDPRIFQLLFTQFNIIPEKSVYIDDSAINVKAAKNLNMNVIHFRDPKTFETELAQFIDF